MSIIKSLQWRYATKKFDSSKMLSSDKIQILKKAFNLTALSYGLQTLKLVIIEEKEKREKLLEHAFEQSQIVNASHLLILCIQSSINEEDIDNHYNTIKAIRQTSDTILETYKNQLKVKIAQMAEGTKRDWAARQAYIALGNLMTVCATEGIDSCPMEGFIPQKFDKILGLEALGLNSVLLLPVGYRAEDDLHATLKKVRKPLTDTIIEL